MLNDALWLNDPVKMNKAFDMAKATFGENLPYVLVRTMDGYTVKFTERFIDLVLIAMSTNSISEMTSDEREVLSSFIDYQNGSVDRDITVKVGEIPEALDQVLMNMVYNVPNEFI